MKDYRIVFATAGGPDVLEREAIDPPVPGPGELLIRNGAVGLNFIDTYYRNGFYRLNLPSGLGQEAAGTVEAVGQGTSSYEPGDRVAFLGLAPGSYATVQVVPEARTVKLPDKISTDVAAAALLKGCTAEALIERCAKVQAGSFVLVHAAAGGVGSILVQWLSAIGAKVIAHAGTAEKAELARAAGAFHATFAPLEELAAEVRDITAGQGAATVFDATGAASWQATLTSVARRGLIVSYGDSSGPVPAYPMRDLTRAGSIFVTRPTLFDYIATEGELRASAARLFSMIEQGAVNVQIGNRFPLSEAAEAHRALEERRTIGSTVLIP